jgi:hypothetical protein
VSVSAWYSCSSKRLGMVGEELDVEDPMPERMASAEPLQLDFDRTQVAAPSHCPEPLKPGAISG